MAKQSYIEENVCTENNCDVVIVPSNLTNKFQPLDLSENYSFQISTMTGLLIRSLRSFKMEKILPMLKYHPSYRIWNPYMRDGLLIGIIMW